MPSSPAEEKAIHKSEFQYEAPGTREIVVALYERCSEHGRESSLRWQCRHCRGKIIGDALLTATQEATEKEKERICKMLDDDCKEEIAQKIREGKNG